MSDEPFQRNAVVDEPGIVGARWWQESLDQQVSRRAALQALLVGGALVAVAGGAYAAISAATAPDHEVQSRPSLTMQREYGWSFGAVGEVPAFDGPPMSLLEKASLERLSADVAPASSVFAPWGVTTLLESTFAKPRSKPAGDAETHVLVAEILRELDSPAMATAYRRGEALTSSLAKTGGGVAVVVDLPGPESVAFAAGAAEALDPVFVIDNWPHPRGVVPAHLTLAALGRHQARFAKTRATRPKRASPMFVLDRNRLLPYVDDNARFDNRHVARLPTGADLAKHGLQHLIYVVPSSGAVELDDLNEPFATELTGVSLHLLAAPELDRSPAAGIPGQPHRPVRRATPFSGSGGRVTPAGFGTVPVVVALGSGVILGAKMSRSGSWTRASSYSGG